MSSHRCRACGYFEQSSTISAKEMMLGLKTTFEYFECGGCGSVQIAEVPKDLGRYYPGDYYSFKKASAIKRYLKCEWARYAFSGRGITGAALTSFFGENLAVASVRRLELSKDAAILDVGCGSGDLLQELRCLGFRRLWGVDPYNQEDIQIDEAVRIERKELREVQKQFDVVMLHHSFEHMENPRDVFKEAHRILVCHGMLLLRVPVASSFAWKEYRADWVQLDAPRHLFIPSEKAITILSEEFGFKVDQVVHDSTAFQFWGSEQYKKGISLSDKSSHQRNPMNLLFPSKAIKCYERQAAELNQQGMGDQACFYLRKLED